MHFSRTTSDGTHSVVKKGWHVIKTRSGSELIWHNGGTGGYSSSMALDLDKKNAVIILSNVSAFNPKMANIDTLCFSLITTLKE